MTYLLVWNINHLPGGTCSHFFEDIIEMDNHVANLYTIWGDNLEVIHALDLTINESFQYEQVTLPILKRKK